LGIEAALQATGPLTLHAVPAVCVDALDDAPMTMLMHQAWLAAPGASNDTARALPDGNRGAILVEATCTFAGRAWCVAIKGVGGRAPMYGNTPIGFAHGHDFEGTLHAAPLIHAITRESWMGESPYGGQGIENALHALALTRLAQTGVFEPAQFCPVFAVIEIPEAHVQRALHYRAYEGRIVQEHRLVPSTVRLYHQSAIALGRDCAHALSVLGVSTLPALELFLDRFIATGLALLTIGSRHIRVEHGAFRFFDYDDAWLDKDAFIAPDGAIVFADLEALIEVDVTSTEALRARIQRQVDRNAYELLYGIDALLHAIEERRGITLSARERRAQLAERITLALTFDPVVRAEARDEGLVLILRQRFVGESARMEDVHLMFLAGR
jgi:hypothetical protein